MYVSEYGEIETPNSLTEQDADEAYVDEYE